MSVPASERIQNHRIECEWCEEYFYSSRYNARFCPDKDCRVKSHRARKRQDNIINRIHGLMTELGDLSRKDNFLTGYAAAGLRLTVKQADGMLEYCDYQFSLFEQDN